MITVGMNYEVRPGKDDDFVAVFAKVIQIMQAMDGHSETHLYRDVYREHDYLIISEWSEKTAFDRFIASDQFRNVADWGKRSILAGRPKHEIYGSGDNKGGGDGGNSQSAPDTCPADAH